MSDLQALGEAMARAVYFAHRGDNQYRPDHPNPKIAEAALRHFEHWKQQRPEDWGALRTEVTAVLAALEAAGYAVVKRAEIERLREALEPFARLSDWIEQSQWDQAILRISGFTPDGSHCDGGSGLNYKHLKAARAALARARAKGETADE